jgi:hypothetical protein
MVKSNLKFVIILFLFSGCITYGLPDLQEDINSKSLDKSISETEFDELYKNVSDSDDSKLELFEDKQELYKYLVVYLRKINRDASIWNPNPEVKIKPFNVNVYLENSGSMNGYVEGVTDFENSIYDMLGNIKTNELCDSLNLNFINNTITNPKKNVLAPDIRDFVNKLSPTTFKNHGGDLTSSDLTDVIKKMLNKTNDNNLSILISDLVFSPGSGAKAGEYLNNQKVSIRINLTQKIQTQNLAVAIYQLQTNFSGYYYDLNNNPTLFNGKRPYYIWIFGNEQMISHILKDQIIRNSDPHILNKAVFTSTKSIEHVEAKVVRANKIGDFRSEGHTGITEARSEQGNFSFSVAVNFGQNLRDPSYFSDSGNYISSNPNYKIQSRALTEVELQSVAYKGYTHLIQLSTNKLVPEVISVKVISQIPQWVFKYSNLDDSNISSDIIQQTQTFGLKHLFEGVSGAFNSKPNIKDNIISEFKISIKVE